MTAGRKSGEGIMPRICCLFNASLWKSKMNKSIWRLLRFSQTEFVCQNKYRKSITSPTNWQINKNSSKTMQSLNYKWNQKTCQIWRHAQRPKTCFPLPSEVHQAKPLLHRAGHALSLHSVWHLWHPTKIFSFRLEIKHLKWPKTHQNLKGITFYLLL